MWCFKLPWTVSPHLQAALPVHHRVVLLVRREVGERARAVLLHFIVVRARERHERGHARALERIHTQSLIARPSHRCSRPQNAIGVFDEYLKLSPKKDLEIARAAVYKEKA